MHKSADRLHIFATITPKAEFFNDAKKALEELVPPTLEETGCHLFTVFLNRDNPGVLHLFEIFENEEAVQLHYEKDYTKEVFAKYENWLQAPVEIQHLSATSLISAKQFP